MDLAKIWRARNEKKGGKNNDIYNLVVHLLTWEQDVKYALHPAQQPAILYHETDLVKSQKVILYCAIEIQSIQLDIL